MEACLDLRAPRKISFKYTRLQARGIRLYETLEKLYSMLICTRHKLTQLAREQLDIYCGTTRLDNVSSQEYLGRGSQFRVITPNGVYKDFRGVMWGCFRRSKSVIISSTIIWTVAFRFAGFLMVLIGIRL